MYIKYIFLLMFIIFTPLYTSNKVIIYKLSNNEFKHWIHYIIQSSILKKMNLPISTKNQNDLFNFSESIQACRSQLPYQSEENIMLNSQCAIKVINNFLSEIQKHISQLTTLHLETAFNTKLALTEYNNIVTYPIRNPLVKYILDKNPPELKPYINRIKKADNVMHKNSQISLLLNNIIIKVPDKLNHDTLNNFVSYFLQQESLRKKTRIKKYTLFLTAMVYDKYLQHCLQLEDEDIENILKMNSTEQKRFISSLMNGGYNIILEESHCNNLINKYLS